MILLHRVAAWLEIKAECWPKLARIATLMLFGLCFGPWLFIHFEHLWHREHYQFFPMMLLAVAGICWSRISDARQNGMTFKSLVLSIPIAVLAALLFAAAARLFSPWLAFLSALVIAWLLFRNIPFGRSSIAPLLILLPLPFAIDGEFVHGLQRASSRGASAILDLLSVQHLMSGNVLEVADRTFFVEEACSGIGSVFLLLATAAIYASWRELRLIAAIPFMLAAIFWAVAGNTFRIAAVAIAHERYATDLSKGTEHDVLGSATYVASLLLLIMTEQVILLLFDPIAVNVASKSSLRLRTSERLATFWNLWTIQDRDHRTNQYLERSLSGRRLDTSRFLIIVGLMLAAGSAVNLWSFRTEIKSLLDRWKPPAAKAPTLDQTLLDRENESRSKIPASLASLPLDVVPGLNIVAAQDHGGSKDVESPVPGLISHASKSWNITFAETPATLTIHGPFSDHRLSTHLITDLAETWTLTEDSTFPVVEIAGQTPIVLERLTRSGADQFRHQFVATVNGRSDLLEISTTGTRQGDRDLPLSLNPTKPLSDRDEYWTILLTFESDRPIPANMRKSRADLFIEILRALHKQRRTEP